MKNFILAIAVLLLLFIGTQTQPLQIKRETNLNSKLELLRARIKRFANYQTDFSTFLQSNRGNSSEFEITYNFFVIANRVGEYTNSAHTLLSIYKGLSCEADRTTTRPVIKNELTYYAKQIDMDIQEANYGLSYTRIPALATSGTQLREDLRDIKSLLESIELQ